MTRDLGRLFNHLTEAERAAVSTAATLIVKRERLEAAVLADEPVDVGDLVRVSDAVADALDRLPKPGP